MQFFRSSLSAIVVVALVAGACKPSFIPKKFKGTNEALYVAAKKEYHARRFENAIAAFERLTLELPARDTLLARSHFWLGKSHARHGEQLLAAQEFARVTEGFPDDPLGDDALVESGRAYQRLWRKPELDAQYGLNALSAYRLLLAIYPNSPLRDEASRQVSRLEQAFATKDYENGLHYMRRKAYDSAIIYLKDVVRNYPTSSRARDASLRLVEAYRAIRYKDDAAETCAALRVAYAQDADVRRLCGAEPTPPVAQPATVPPASVPAATP